MTKKTISSYALLITVLKYKADTFFIHVEEDHSQHSKVIICLVRFIAPIYKYNVYTV